MKKPVIGTDGEGGDRRMVIGYYDINLEIRSLIGAHFDLRNGGPKFAFTEGDFRIHKMEADGQLLQGLQQGRFG